MVNLKEIRASNKAFKESNSGLVAVFVGATSGIGMGTLRQFAKHATSPKIYILLRSKDAAKPLLDQLKASNPQATFHTIETEISLMRNVDEACDEIKSKEKKVDLLHVSPGYLSFDARNESIEGIDIPHALRYYTRLRFVYSLLPLLRASPNPRVISILGGGQEGELDLNDLEVKNDFTFIKAAKNGVAQMTLAFEELAKSNPTISFIHKYPGLVDTGVIERLMGTTTGVYGVLGTIFNWSILPILNLFASTVDEAGERGVFLATSSRYPPIKSESRDVGIPLPKGVDPIIEDSGVYRLGPKDDSVDPTPTLIKYRQEGTSKIVWEATLATWERALARSG